MATPAVPRAIEVKNLRKFFRVQGSAPRGPLDRLIHPVKRKRQKTLRVLDGITFEVGRGERFGVIGRNGSGKSTLLRILGSIYSADAGQISIVGRVAPFLELGTGFQPQMSARQNVALNGVMLGLSRREVRRRIDEVIAYAELEDFADLQLKNFSSGMRVRLAFASMLQADPDIYLLDEIFAVGDEAFREKCTDELDGLRRRGKTILLVSHRPGKIERQSDRAMLLEDGRIAAIGETGHVLARYHCVDGQDAAGEFAGSGSGDGSGGTPQTRMERGCIATLSVEQIDGSTHPRLGTGDQLHASIEAEASGWVQNPTLEIVIRDDGGLPLFVTREADPECLAQLKPGERLVADVKLESPLAPGRYRLDCALLHDKDGRPRRVSPIRSVEFEIAGVPGEGHLALKRVVSLKRADLGLIG